MISRIQFKNFKVLRDAKITLGRLNVLVGPNGVGKSSVLQALQLFKGAMDVTALEASLSVAAEVKRISVDLFFDEPDIKGTFWWRPGEGYNYHFVNPSSNITSAELNVRGQKLIAGTAFYALDAAKMRQAVPVRSSGSLDLDGANIAAFLDNLRDNGTDRFDSLVSDLHRIVPEYDGIGLYVPKEKDGHKAFKLRLTGTRDYVPASSLSEGTVYLIAYLAIAYQAKPPSVVCIEEPERGLHPRVLRELHTSLMRLSYPEQFGDKRPPTQVICTTHSPYFIDLFKETPECITICERDEKHGVRFKNLADEPDIKGQLSEMSLGEIWYSGVLGGVPNLR